MCGALASFLHTTHRVIEPFRASTEFAIHRNANGDAKGCILAASVEQNGNHAPNFEWLAFKFFHIVHCVVTGFNIGRGHDKWGPSVVQKGIVTELVIPSLKLHIHVLWPKVYGRSNGAQFVEVAFVPWLELWQVVVQHINDTWQGQIEQNIKSRGFPLFCAVMAFEFCLELWTFLPACVKLLLHSGSQVVRLHVQWASTVLVTLTVSRLDSFYNFVKDF